MEPGTEAGLTCTMGESRSLPESLSFLGRPRFLRAASSEQKRKEKYQPRIKLVYARKKSLEQRARFMLPLQQADNCV